MIQHYTDHAANERTFLAWVRTAIAVMAFGFLVEKFDLFLELSAQPNARRRFEAEGHLVGNVAGLFLIMLGGAMLALAIARFRATAKAIDDPETHAGSGTRTDVILASLLALLGFVLFVYLAYTVVSRL